VTPRIRIGTRGSALALIQARWVQHEIESRGHAAELVIITTSGDRFTDRPLTTVGGKGLFVKEIEEALVEGRIDCAVHSMKDLPAVLAAGLTIAAVPAREDPRDIAVTRTGRPLAELAAGSRVGTTSLRRTALLCALRNSLSVVPLRGNVDTRLRKLDAGDLDAIVLAAAGLHRLGVTRSDIEYLDASHFVPAIGQGALAIETRIDDIPSPLLALDHPFTRIAVGAERAFLTRVGGSCHTPLGAYAEIKEAYVNLRAFIASPDGTRMLRGERRADHREAVAMGVTLAEELLAMGGDEILRSLEGP
jgi:hydroxymethylbilane synthase